ncbi:MAG: ATP-binding protein, partial [Planctomycetota bacterium]
IQSPPFEKLGVLDLETFYPRGDRAALAMRLNGLLASPGFAAWLEGEPLEIQRLLYAPDGRPRLSVLSISHLSDEERMSFVTVLLGEILSWVRTQPGTSSLRALLYMDEIFGYFPPTANPPSKKPMLTLLKQARAFGLGVVLSTQNPVDLDYKGLSNCGTWFLGRLQTERDKLRVLDGLQGALSEGGGLNRSALEKMLSGMEKRTFLLHNVHEEKPALFRTRWVLSYLRGPLTRPEIERVTAKDKADPASPSALKAEKKERIAASEEAGAKAAAKRVAAAPPDVGGLRPELPEGIAERFLPLGDEPAEGDVVLYRPGLYAEVQAHYANSRMGVDHWVTFHGYATIAEDEPAVDWEEATIEEEPLFGSRGGKRPRKGARFDELPSTARKITTWNRWHRTIKTELYQSRTIELLKDPVTKLKSEPGETPAAFRARSRQAHVEKRDLALEKLRKKFATKIDRAEERVRKAHEKLGVQEEQLEEKSSSSWISMGTSLLGALFSRKKVSATNMRRAGSAMKQRNRVAKEKQDVERAERELKEREEEMRQLERDFEAAVSDIPEPPAAASIELDEVIVRPRKSDFALDPPVLLWTPWIVGADGSARRG